MYVKFCKLSFGLDLLAVIVAVGAVGNADLMVPGLQDASWSGASTGRSIETETHGTSDQYQQVPDSARPGAGAHKE